MHRKFQIFGFPLFQRGGSVTRPKISVKNLRKKPNLINNLSLKKTGNTFFSFVYVQKEQEFKHLKFSVHLYYWREFLTQFLSSTLLEMSNQTSNVMKHLSVMYAIQAYRLEFLNSPPIHLLCFFMLCYEICYNPCLLTYVSNYVSSFCYNSCFKFCFKFC